MQQKEINTPLTLDDLCSFDLFKKNNCIIEKEENIISNFDTDNIAKDNGGEGEEDEDNENVDESNTNNEDDANEESNEDEVLNKNEGCHNDCEEPTEETETEEEKSAMRQLRSFPNVAFSRFSGQNSFDSNSIENNNHSNTKIDTKYQSIQNSIHQNQFIQSLNQFCQYNPNYRTASTFHSSMNNSLYSKDSIHRSMPIQPAYQPYSQYGFQHVPQRENFPFQVGFNHYPVTYYNSPIPMMYNNTNTNYPMSNNPNINGLLKPSNQVTDKNKKLDIIENYNTLEELLSSLKNGKQIGNYIKARNNSGTMINLIKKLSPKEISDLIEMIKPKIKEIMITNNKFSQKLFEQCNAEQRLQILKGIQHTFIEIALNKWGSYSLQALIKAISLPEEQEIVKQCIEGKVYELAMDKQANFVLQKLILLFNEKGMLSITDEIFDIFHHLIYNSSGIGLLKNLVLTNKGSDTRKKFVIKIIDNLDNIINNSAGHCLLLQMMDKWDYETCKAMIIEIVKDIGKYSMMKYSSIVVLKCISISDIKLAKTMFPTLFRSELVFQLMKTDTGNDIVRELFIKLTKKMRNEALKLLEKTLSEMKEKNSNPNASIPEFVKELILKDNEKKDDE